MLSMRTKILTVILFCVLISNTLVVFIGTNNAKKTIINDSQNTMHLLCDERTTEINSILNNVEQSVNILYEYTMKEIKDNPSILNNSENQTVFLSDLHKLSSASMLKTKDAITSYFHFSPEIPTLNSGIFLEVAGYNSIIDLDICDLNKYDKDDIEHVGWYFEPIKARQAIWLDPYLNKNIDMEIISYVIPIFYNNTTIGIIGMDLKMDTIKNYIKNIKPYQTGYAMLSGDDGSIFYHPQYVNGLKSTDFDDKTNTLQKICQTSRNTSEIQNYSWNDNEKLMLSTKLINGMYFTIMAQKKEIDMPATNFIIQFLVLLFYIIAFVLLISIFFANRITKPIRHLTNAAAEIANGNFDYDIQCNTHDEISILANSIKDAAHQLKEQNNYINEFARTDVLTGFKNQTAYSERLVKIDAELRNGKTDFAVIIMDINNLKHANDTYGHEVGDDLIRNCSLCIKNVFHNIPVYRIGGDEFAAILRNTEKPYSQYLDKLTTEISILNAQNFHHIYGELQLAAGLAEFEPNKSKSFADVFKTADMNMYKNKKALKGDSI